MRSYPDSYPISYTRSYHLSYPVSHRSSHTVSDTRSYQCRSYSTCTYTYTYTYTKLDKLACRGRFAPLPSIVCRNQMPNQFQNPAINATTDRARAPKFPNSPRTIPAMTASALRKTGSTRQWRNLRKPLLIQLTRNGFINCSAQRSPQCLNVITQPTDLVAGHVVPRAHGGNDHQLQPECRPCSDHQGGQLRHAAQMRRAPLRTW